LEGKSLLLTERVRGWGELATKKGSICPARGEGKKTDLKGKWTGRRKENVV